WLVRHLPLWRASEPDIELEIIGTDNVLNLRSGEADVAIRYMFALPHDLLAHELFRDKFIPVCSPNLLPFGKPLERFVDMRSYPLLRGYWSPHDPHAPTWERWLGWMRDTDSSVPALDEFEQLRFSEELHMIDAAIGGLGIAVCGDVLVAEELRDGTLIP